jgi:anti-sigma factor RsiW
VIELTCRELVELITDYLEGTLEPSARAGLETHLAGCAGCTIYLEQMRTTMRLSGMLTVEHIPEGAARELLDVFRTWRREA